MSLESLVAAFGLPFLFVGAGTEGEAVAMTGGALAHRGMLPLSKVWFAVFGGSLVQGQALFMVGRHLQTQAWVKRVLESPACGRILQSLQKHPVALVVSFRFVFGLRSITPLLMGTSKVSAVRFSLFNVVGASIWTTTFVGLGFVCGTAIEHLFGYLPTHIHFTLIIACVVLLMSGVWFWRRWIR